MSTAVSTYPEIQKISGLVYVNLRKLTGNLGTNENLIKPRWTGICSNGTQLSSQFLNLLVLQKGNKKTINYFKLRQRCTYKEQIKCIKKQLKP